MLQSVSDDGAWNRGKNYRVRASGVATMKWGIYDTKDSCWLGDDRGPRVFDDDDPIFKGDAFPMARVAAEMIDIQMKWPPKRSIPREFDPAGLCLKDELPIQRTIHDAMRGKLSGKYW